MDEGNPREEIERLEERIEGLADTIESCRKIILASRVAIALGGVLFLAIMFGAIQFDPTLMSAAIAALLGGIVFLGSNSSTSQEAADQLRAAEAHRAELIGLIDLRVVGDGGGATRREA